jgi:DNA repair exonuclease SbcCD ATPase subunit
MFKQLTIRNYKKFNEQHLQFKPGVNVIWGKNEAGKSSVMSAIADVLFTDATTKAKHFYEAVTNWETKNKEIYLQLQLDSAGKQFRIVKDFGNDAQELKDLETGKAFQEQQSIADKLRSEFNIFDQKIFEATSFVRQSEVTDIQFSQDLRAALQRVSSVSSQGGDLENFIAEMEKELRQLQLGLKRPAKNPGPIKATEDEIKSVKENLNEMLKLWAKYKTVQKTGDDSQEKLKKTEKQIKELEKLFENYKKNERATKRLQEVEKQLSELTSLLNQVEQQEVALKRLAAQLEQLKAFANQSLEADTEELLAIKQKNKFLQEQLVEVENEIASAAPAKLDYLQQSNINRNLNLLLILSLVSFVSSASSAVVGFFISSGVFIGLAAVLIVLAVVLLAMSAYLYLSQSRSDNGAVKQQEESTQRLQAKASQLNTQLAQIKQQQQQLISKYGVDELNSFYTSKAQYTTLNQEMARTKTAIEAALGGKSLESVKQRQLELLTEKKEIEVNELTEEVRATKLSANEYLRKRRELDTLLIERKKLEKENIKSEVVAEDKHVDQEKILHLQERLEILETRLDELEERAEVLELTIKLLREVIKKTGKAVSEYVSQEVEKFLPKLTMGRYKDMRLTGAYNIEIFSSKLNDWIDPINKLSLGTVDQIYLLSRIAIARALLSGNLNYLLLDDPFVTFDSERLKQMESILQELGKSTQIFVFTHNRNYQGWGNFIEVDEE